MFTACLWTSTLYGAESENEDESSSHMESDHSKSTKALFTKTYPLLLKTIRRLVREEKLAKKLAEETFLEIRAHTNSSNTAYCREQAIRKVVYHYWYRHCMAV